MNNLVFLFGIIFLVTSNGNYAIIFFSVLNTMYIYIYFLEAASLKNKQLTLRGRIIFPNGPKVPIEEGGILTVVLQDVSLMDAPAKSIGKGVGKAIRFPMAFAIKYSPDKIVPGGRYSLRVMIKNKKNELLYTNDMHIGVTPVGEQRTKLIDVPVILVKSKTIF